MYPTRELNHLSIHKARLHRRITSNRNQLKLDASRIAEPLMVLNPYMAVLREVSPLVALVLRIFIRCTISPRIRKLQSSLRWIPLITGIFRISHFLIQKHEDA